MVLIQPVTETIDISPEQRASFMRVLEESGITANDRYINPDDEYYKNQALEEEHAAVSGSNSHLAGTYHAQMREKKEELARESRQRASQSSIISSINQQIEILEQRKREALERIKELEREREEIEQEYGENHERILELQGKEASGTLTENEKQELEQRENKEEQIKDDYQKNIDQTNKEYKNLEDINGELSELKNIRTEENARQNAGFKAFAASGEKRQNLVESGISLKVDHNNQEYNSIVYQDDAGKLFHTTPTGSAEITDQAELNRVAQEISAGKTIATAQEVQELRANHETREERFNRVSSSLEVAQGRLEETQNIINTLEQHGVHLDENHAFYQDYLDATEIYDAEENWAHFYETELFYMGENGGPEDITTNNYNLYDAGFIDLKGLIDAQPADLVHSWLKTEPELDPDIFEYAWLRADELFSDENAVAENDSNQESEIETLNFDMDEDAYAFSINTELKNNLQEILKAYPHNEEDLKRLMESVGLKLELLEQVQKTMTEEYGIAFENNQPTLENQNNNFGISTPGFNPNAPGSVT